MSKIVIEYDTYFEIKNGLFYPSVPDAQFTFIENLYEPSNRVTERNLIDRISYMFETSNTNRINSRDLVLYSSAEASENFYRSMESELQRERALRNIIRDESEGITREQFEAAYPRQSDGPDFNEASFIVGTSSQGNYIAGFDPILNLSDTVAVTHNPNEEMSHQLTNMSEQELIEYFDRISQEEN